MSVKWTEMTGEERYRVVELVRKGEQSVKEICETFGVSRQALHRAMERMEAAAKAALEPGKPGRKSRPEEEQRIIELSKKQSSLEEEIAHWKKRFEVAQGFIDLQRTTAEKERMMAKRERDKKKRRGTGRGPSGQVLARREAPRLAVVDDGAGAGDTDGEPEGVDEEA